MPLKLTPLNLLPYSKVKEALKDDPELFEFWKQRIDHQSKDIIPFDKNIYNLSPEKIRSIIKFIKEFEEKQKQRHG